LKRKAIDGLIEWNSNQLSKPVLLSGAKGVGKTYLAYDFARSFFEQILYINFEREPISHEFFRTKDSLETAKRLVKHFKLSEDVADNTDGRILILDEISFYPEALFHLIPLKDSGFFPRIIVITSSLVPETYSSKLMVLPIHPLEFDEFLLATANDWYIEAITTHFETNKPLPEIVHKELLALHELYMRIGGMPGTINEYLNFNSLVNIPEQHSLQIGAYHDYILQSNPEGEALKMNQVIDSLALQLLKPNKKFQYKLIRKGTTYAMYKDAILMLKELEYALQCSKCQIEELMSPNTDTTTAVNSEELTSFKLYLPDTGFLYSRISEENFPVSDPIVRKALLENYVAQAFHAKADQLWFWESDSMAKVDFILRREDCLIPVEVHIDENTRSKSISVLKQRYDFPYAVKISPKNFDYSNQVKYVPYYAVFCL
jgi:hypothetical protein